MESLSLRNCSHSKSENTPLFLHITHNSLAGLQMWRKTERCLQIVRVSYHQLTPDFSQLRCLHFYCFGERTTGIFLKFNHLCISVLCSHLLSLSNSQLFFRKALLYSVTQKHFHTQFAHSQLYFHCKQKWLKED